MPAPSDISDSMRARLDAELRALDRGDGREVDRGDAREDDDETKPGGTFSLGQIALAAWLGAGFGGVLLTSLNDWRLGNRPVWRSAALFSAFLMASIVALTVTRAGELPQGLGHGLKLAINVGGATAIAALLQGRQIGDTPGESRAVRFVVGAIVLGWPAALAFWVPLSLLLKG